MRALVLAGGGAAGSWQAGAVDVLWTEAERRGDPYQIVSGTSVGALNASILVQDGPGRLVELWRQISSDQVYRSPWGWLGSAWRALRARGAIYDTAPLRELIARELDPGRVRSRGRHLLVHAADLEGRAQVTFTEQDTEDLREGVLASASLPVLFPAVEWRGRRLGDGGVVANVPIRSVVRAGADRITVVTPDASMPISRRHARDLGQAPPRDGRRGVVGIVQSLIDVMLDAQVERDLAGVEQVNRILAADPDGDLAQAGYRHIDLEVVQPGSPIGGLLDFDTSRMRALVTTGQADAREHLARRRAAA